MDLTALQHTIEPLVGQVNGLMGVCVRDIKTGEEVGTRLDEPLPMASVCKLPILVTSYRKHEAGQLDLTERVEITDQSRTFGSGLFNAFDVGIMPTVHDLLLMMIVVSDNAATDLILSRLDPGEVTRTMADLGFSHIRADRTIAGLIGDYFVALDPGLVSIKFGEWDAYCEKIPGLKERGKDLEIIREAVNASASTQDTATVRDMAGLCAQITQNRCASGQSCGAMLDIMNKQVLNGRLPRHLPQYTKFPHKTGTLGSGAVVNDAGILYKGEEPVASIVVLSRDVRDPIAETETTIARIGRAVYDHYRA